MTFYSVNTLINDLGTVAKYSGAKIVQQGIRRQFFKMAALGAATGSVASPLFAPLLATALAAGTLYKLVKKIFRGVGNTFSCQQAANRVSLR